MRSSQVVRQILKTTQNKFIRVKFLIRGTAKEYNSDWGYAEGYKTDLGVHEYQKVENP